MGDIGKETHVHGVQTFLLLFLYLCLTCSPTGQNHATGIAVEIISQGYRQCEIDAPGPPGVGRSRLYDNIDGAFVAHRLIAGTVGGAYAQGIVP